jgi:hypothetical protein
VAPIAAAAAAAAGAVFLTRAALRRLGALDEAEDKKARQVAANHVELAAWDKTYAEVTIRNARIARLREKTRSASIAVNIPESFSQGAHTPDEVNEWCRKMDMELAAAEEKVADARVLAALAQPVSPPAEFVRRRVARTLVRRAEPEALSRPETKPGPAGSPSSDSPPSTPTNPQPLPSLQSTVDDILCKAADKVGPEDFAQLTEKATDVLAQEDRRAMRDELDDLFLMETQARKAQERRADDAAWAADWLVALAPLAHRPNHLSAHEKAVLDALRAVAAERREPDEALRLAVRGLANRSWAAAKDRAIIEMIKLELAALGYIVAATDDNTENHVHISAARPAWRDTHRASIRVRDGHLEADFVADEADATGFDAHLTSWANDFDVIKRKADESWMRSGTLSSTGDPRSHNHSGDTDHKQARRAGRRTKQGKEMPIPHADN